LLKREQYKAVAAAVISFLLVTSVWLSVSRGFYTMVSLEVPIGYMNLKPEIEIFDTSVNSVHLHLSGSGALIKSVRPEQVQVKIDMSSAVPGENTFNITPNNIVLPPGVFLKKVEPSFIEASLDIPITKMLPVQVDWVGTLPSDLLLTEAKLKPETVQIIGPGIRLREISTLFTHKVRLESLSKSGRLKADLAFDPEYFKAAPGSPDKVTVEYTIGRRATN
jgi:YbbR domain-containing protein